MVDVIYSALMGKYESVVDQPVLYEVDTPRFLFTDDRNLRSSCWEVVYIEPPVVGDAVRSARYVKVLGHPILEPYRTSLWIDNRVQLLQAPNEMMDEVGRAALVAPTHSFRDSVADEFEAALQGNTDSLVRILEQRATYRKFAPAVLALQPLWTAILYRERSSRLRAAMRVWMDHILRFSRRDQLSLLFALQQEPVPYETFEVDNFRSSYHRWLDVVETSRQGFQRFPQTSQRAEPRFSEIAGAYLQASRLARKVRYMQERKRL